MTYRVERNEIVTDSPSCVCPRCQATLSLRFRPTTDRVVIQQDGLFVEVDTRHQCPKLGGATVHFRAPLK